jgi:hypothetical protein
MNDQMPGALEIAGPLAIREMLTDCKRIANTPADDTHKIASLMQEMILKYYADVRLQAQQSFRAALVVATVGVLFFVYAIWRGMSSDGGEQASLAAIAGGLIQVISGINFYLYARAARQFATFHVCLERTNRFLLANALCEKLSPPERDEMRIELARLVATAPMLTLDVVRGESRRASSGPKRPRGKKEMVQLTEAGAKRT